MKCFVKEPAIAYDRKVLLFLHPCTAQARAALAVGLKTRMLWPVFRDGYFRKDDRSDGERATSELQCTNSVKDMKSPRQPPGPRAPRPDRHVYGIGLHFLLR